MSTFCDLLDIVVLSTLYLVYNVHRLGIGLRLGNIHHKCDFLHEESTLESVPLY